MTEKDYNPKQKEKKSMKKQNLVEKAKKPEQLKKTPKKIEERITDKKSEIKEDKKEIIEKPEEKITDKKEEISDKKEIVDKKSDIKEDKKEIKKETPKIKKTEVSVKGINLPISTKDAKFVCKFIVRKRIGDAIRDLQKVVTKKKAVPMKGEIPHRKGRGISSGRFPKKAAENFIIVLKSLAANANQSNLDEPVITEAIANMAARPYGRFGRTQKKRTHIKIIAKEKNLMRNKK